MPVQAPVIVSAVRSTPPQPPLGHCTPPARSFTYRQSRNKLTWRDIAVASQRGSEWEQTTLCTSRATGMKKTLVTIGFVCGTLVATGLLKGCASEQRPLPLNPSEEILLGHKGLGLALGVEPSTPPVYAQSLLRALQETGLFRDVQSSDKIHGPHLLVRVEKPITGNAVIPFLTFITLGLIPTVTEEHHGYSFSLRSSASSARTVSIEYVHRGYTVLGWIAGALNFVPQWTGGGIQSDPRFKDRLKLAILLKAEDIKAVAVQ